MSPPLRRRGLLDLVATLERAERHLRGVAAMVDPCDESNIRLERALTEVSAVADPFTGSHGASPEFLAG